MALDHILNTEFDKDLQAAFGELTSEIDNFNLSVIDVHRLLRKVKLDEIFLQHIDKSVKSFKISFANSVKNNTSSFLPKLISIYNDALNSKELSTLDRSRMLSNFLDNLNQSFSSGLNLSTLSVNNHFNHLRINILKTVEYFQRSLIDERNKINKMLNDYETLQEHNQELQFKVHSLNKEINIAKSDLAQYQDELDSSRSAVGKLSIELGQSQELAKSLKSQIKMLESFKGNDDDVRIRKLTNHNENLKNQVKNLKLTMEMINSPLTCNQSKHHKLDLQVQKLEAQINKLKTQSNSGKSNSKGNQSNDFMNDYGMRSYTLDDIRMTKNFVKKFASDDFIGIIVSYIENNPKSREPLENFFTQKRMGKLKG